MNSFNKKIFGTLFFSIFATVTGVGIVIPLLPIYARDMGASGLYIGLIFGSFSLSRTFFLPYFGRLSDKKGRKPFIVIGLFTYALISFAFILSHSVESLIVLRFIQGITSALILPVTQAYVGDITPEGREGFTMGVFNMSIFLGLSIGPLIGGWVHDRFNLQATFVSMGFLALIGFLFSLLLLPPTRSEQSLSRKNGLISWAQLLQDKELIGLCLFRFTYLACIGIILGFLPVYADSAFSLSSTSIGILVMLGIFVSGLMQIPMGFLADRVNRNLMIIIGGLITGIAIFLFEWAGGFWDLFFDNVLFGLGGGISMPAIMALALIKGNNTKAMGSVMALMTMAHSMGMFAGSILAGLVMDIFQLRQAFFLGSLIMGFGVCFFTICIYAPKPNGLTHGIKM
ncbi:MAG TPA: MFS transporter [Desulfobacterales bacterium]|nr:MFS transporter [Desulfobacterales bacterium]